jgi:hypothetical protein
MARKEAIVARKKPRLVSNYARMWPREVLDRYLASGEKPKMLAKHLEILDNPGIYILYRDGMPYYIGRADKLRTRLLRHAWDIHGGHYNLWNFFSFFVVDDRAGRDEIEGILIAAMPTANGAKPKLPRERMPKNIATMLRELRRFRANPHAPKTKVEPDENYDS